LRLAARIAVISSCAVGSLVVWISFTPLATTSPSRTTTAPNDFAIARDGKIAAVYLFFDDLPN
jgi:hypothetical protein